MKKTYPALARNRLKGKQIAVVFVGSVDSGIHSTVGRALTDAGAQQVRMRALKVPIDSQQLDAALKGQPAAAGLRGKANLESLGRALGQELVLGGDTPLWNPLTRSGRGARRRQQDSGGRRGRRSHGRTAARTGRRSSCSACTKGSRRPACRRSESSRPTPPTRRPRPSARPASRPWTTWTRRSDGSRSCSCSPVSRPGQYGVKDTASDGALPPLPVRTATAGG